MTQLYANNAYSALNGAISAGALSLTLASSTGSRFPSPTGGDFFLLTLADVSGGSESAWEIVKVTARTNDVLTIVRAQESTSARAWATGTPVDLRITAGTTTDVQAAINELDTEKAAAGANTDITSINGTTIPTSKTLVVTTDIGSSVQAYDVDTAKTDVEQTWLQVQRTNESIGTSLTLNLDAGYLDFRCTPSGGGALTFSNIPASPLVQKGTIRFINGSNYAITAHANTKILATDLTKISATGTYLLSYRTSDGNVYVVCSGGM